VGDSCAGRVAVVTGGSRGIGRAVAIRLASEGCDLALVARDVEGVRLGRSLAGTVEEIERMGRRVTAIGCDLTDPSVRRESIIDRVEAELGGADILVNNAAMSVFKSVAEWTDDKLRAMQEVNVWAPWQLIRRVLPRMRERRAGWIVNVTSGSADPRRATVGGAAYGGTKAMLDQMTRCLGLELADTGVVANALAPQGASRTEFVETLVARNVLTRELTEPVEAMAEATFVMATAPGTIQGEVRRSLELLAELHLPVHDLLGESVLPGYSVGELGERIDELTTESYKRRDLRGAWGRSWGHRQAGPAGSA
jgi:NAD(P)-dependent dehydrogenase (short-subunit alcohol dehydrogenase family)